MIFQSIKTLHLKKTQIFEIIKLKNTYWKFGLRSQTEWFYKNSFPNDLHNIIINKKKIIGYTFLANRFYSTYNAQKKTKKKKYILFSSLIINKKFRNIKNASKLMNFNNKIIKKNKKISFLYCDKDKINFYKFFNWTTLTKKDFKVPDHKSNQIGMLFCLSKKVLIKNKEFKFYYYL